jgi:Glycosyltransferase like family
MIAFGCSITSRETFDRLALPGIRRASERDSLVLDRDSTIIPYATYNAMLDELAGRDDVEAVVFLHQDLVIEDDDFAAKLRRRLADSEVALVGNAGGRGVESIAWWEGEVLGSWHWAHGNEPAYQYEPTEWENFVAESRTGSHEVEALDGMLHVLSPWAMRELRYDESVNAGGVHGCDVDICFQARAAGRKVVVEELRTVHHQGREVLGEDTEPWVEAHVRFARKWASILPARDEVGDCESRALRGEAEAAAARVQRGEQSLIRNDSERRLAEAIRSITRLETELDRVRRELQHEIDVRQAELDSIRSSRSWRLTSAMRAAGQALRRGGS